MPALVTVPLPFIAGSTALTADVLGVDSQGRITYALHQVEIAGTTTLPLTATIVQGSDHVAYELAATGVPLEVNFGFNCDLPGDGPPFYGHGRLSKSTVTGRKHGAVPSNRHTYLGQLDAEIFGLCARCIYLFHSGGTSCYDNMLEVVTEKWTHQIYCVEIRLKFDS
ncbi:hypothetical protein C8R43DRAFT_941050 [Mycena crocata]|nr:hypothetical protein C8R43DRAFT_941050 [Mycena crocata]